MSALSDPKERALFVILVEHDVEVWKRKDVGTDYVECPDCGALRGEPCRGWARAERHTHSARVDLRQRTMPDLSDIHIATRRRIRDLFEHDVYPEDLLT